VFFFRFLLADDSVLSISPLPSPPLAIFFALRNNVDIPGLLTRFGLVDLSKKEEEERKEGEKPGWFERLLGKEGTTGTLLLAILCNKACFVFRTPITLTITPIVARQVAKFPALAAKLQ
jgi:hypothetical protein